MGLVWWVLFRRSQHVQWAHHSLLGKHQLKNYQHKKIHTELIFKKDRCPPWHEEGTPRIPVKFPSLHSFSLVNSRSTAEIPTTLLKLGYSTPRGSFICAAVQQHAAQDGAECWERLDDWRGTSKKIAFCYNSMPFTRVVFGGILEITSKITSRLDRLATGIEDSIKLRKHFCIAYRKAIPVDAPTSSFIT